MKRFFLRKLNLSTFESSKAIKSSIALLIYARKYQVCYKLLGPRQMNNQAAIKRQVRDKRKLYLA